MPRAGIVALLGLLLLAGIFLGAWMLAENRTAPEATVAASQPSLPERVPDSLAAEEATERESLSLVAESQPEPASVPVAEPAPVPAHVTLNGEALWLDAQGLEHAGEDGHFTLFWRRGAEQTRHEVEVLAGSFSIPVAPDVGLIVRDLVLGGIPVTLDPDRFTLPPDHFLTLRGHGRHPVLLHVLSAADDSELDQIEIWNGPYSFPTDTRHPGAVPDREPVVRGARSPVRVPPRVDSWRSATQYFVRAPGHAWGSIDIDHSAAGERTLVLQPAGALEVELIGSAHWLAPEVRLWPPDASKWDAYAYAKLAPDAEDRAVFESLAPGTYFVSVERGWADRRTSYGSATVDVVAGERLTVPITVELPEKPVAVTVSGTLELPLAWEREGMKLLFGGEGATEKWLQTDREVLLSEMTRLDEASVDSETFAWEVELPLPGSYRLEAFPLLVRRMLDVPTGGLSDIDIVVPFPADVEVRIVDAATGDEIRVESIHWSSLPIEGIVATPLYTAVSDPVHGRPTFRAPAYEIQLAPVDRGLLEVEDDERFLLEPGRNTLEFRVQQQIGVRFTFKDGEAVVPWDWSWRLSAHQVDGDLRDRSRSIGILWFLEEGTYELRSNGIPGFQSIDGTRIEVVRGRGLIDVEVPLTRE